MIQIKDILARTSSQESLEAQAFSDALRSLLSIGITELPYSDGVRLRLLVEEARKQSLQPVPEEHAFEADIEGLERFFDQRLGYGYVESIPHISKLRGGPEADWNWRKMDFSPETHTKRNNEVFSDLFRRATNEDIIP